MKKPVLIILLFIIVAGSFLAGVWYSRREAGPVNSGAVVPAPVATQEDIENEPPDLEPGAVRVSPARQQIIGVRTGIVEAAPVNHTLRVLGRVAADEVRVYRIVSSVDGWIQEAYANSVGTFVKKGKPWPLFTAPSFWMPNRHIYMLLMR